VLITEALHERNVSVMSLFENELRETYLTLGKNANQTIITERYKTSWLSFILRNESGRLTPRNIVPLEKLTLRQLLKLSLTFIQSEGSSRCSQQPVTDAYPEPNAIIPLRFP